MISSQYAAGFMDGEGCINVSSCRSLIIKKKQAEAAFIFFNNKPGKERQPSSAISVSVDTSITLGLIQAI